MKKDEIQEIEGYEASERVFVAHCRSENGRNTEFRIINYGSGVLRFTLGKPKGKESEKIINIPENWTKQPSKISEKAGDIVLDYSNLNVELTKAPFRLKVLEGAGDEEKLWSQMDNDLNVGGQRLIEPLSFMETSGGAIESVVDSYSVANREKIFGFGEKFTGFDKVGQKIRSWVTDAHGTGTNQSYMEVPFFISNLGYGVFFNTSAEVTHEVGFPEVSSGSYRVEVKEPTLDYFLFYGPEPKKILKKYTKLTGRPEVPPSWTFGLWMSRCFYEDGEELLKVARKLREEEISSDVMNFDARTWLKPGHQTNFEWDPDRYENPEKVMEELEELGFKSCFWENPYVSDKTELFKEGKESGYFLTDETGKVKKIKWIPEEYEDFPSTEPSGIVDFTNPEAKEWWKEQHKDLIEMGADSFKTDFGDMVPKNAHSEAGISGDMLHNLYPLLYAETVFEVLEERGKSGVIWDRPGWSGIHKYPIKWGGDPQTTFRAMAQSLKGGLSAGLSGVSFWSHDIGGFYGKKPDPELYIRWAQFGLLSSHTRCHGTTPREPWEFGDEALEIFQKFNNLRYRLLPYIYSEAHHAAEEGLPLMRPLLLEYPGETQAYYRDLEYLLGRDLLVAPVFNRKKLREVYLPDEIWYDFWDETGYEGEQTIDYEVSLEKIPFFIRAGSIIPLADIQNRVGDEMVQPDHLFIYLGGDGNFEMINDNGAVEYRIKERSGEILFQLDTTEGNPLKDHMRLEFKRLTQRPKRVSWQGEDNANGISEWEYDEKMQNLVMDIDVCAELKIKLQL